LRPAVLVRWSGLDGPALLPAPLAAPVSAIPRPYRVIEFDRIAGVACPCGTARRALADVPEFPGTIHRTEITTDAKLHYHGRLSETYYILECGPDAGMQLDDDLVPVRPGTCIYIPPGVRHRAVGRMTVLIVCVPKFDPSDEVVVEAVGNERVDGTPDATSP
jgi:mannose-6-phosphate isomerase-like protein (cupin superfamily)